ncbi:hypothetical protein [Streptomyces sp. MK7]|uniref:hypothetical protein n=1 Tax=Streptomyces sp. MK7 TaxID=3067635 RepID=UPI00293161CE|nr:hypothetical protein [Streptomyces sp. MK7]
MKRRARPRSAAASSALGGVVLADFASRTTAEPEADLGTPLGDRFAVWLGRLLPDDTPFVFITAPGHDSARSRCSGAPRRAG